MKKTLLILLLIPLSIFAQDWQDWDDNIFEMENNPPPLFPFSVSGSYLNVHKARFRTPGFSDSNLKYAQWDTALAYTHPFSKECGLIFGAGWVGTNVDMKNNPEFNETIFNYVNLSFGGFTQILPSWNWTLTLGAFFDTVEFSLLDYTLYQGVLWTRYDLCKWIELDCGAIVEVGLDKEKVWPILGFVYIPCEKWRINAVYPINVSIEYDWKKHLTAAASLRFLRNRHRLKDDEPNSQGIFEYRTTGAEADLTYTPFERVLIKGFAGSTLDGDLKVSNRNDKHSTHYKFHGSFYAGASAVISF